jgi:hypothetical protein
MKVTHPTLHAHGRHNNEQELATNAVMEEH